MISLKDTYGIAVQMREQQGLLTPRNCIKVND